VNFGGRRHIENELFSLLCPSNEIVINIRTRPHTAMFPPPQLPSPEQFLLVTDELAAPADFLLHRILGTHLKDAKRSKIVILSVSEGLARWKAIAAKSVSN
jgi:hypothetical protein